MKVSGSNERLTSSVAVLGHKKKKVVGTQTDGRRMLRTIFCRFHVMVNVAGDLQVPRHRHREFFFC